MVQRRLAPNCDGGMCNRALAGPGAAPFGAHNDLSWPGASPILVRSAVGHTQTGPARAAA